METVTWIAGLIGCGILWIVWEIVGSIVGEAVMMFLGWLFSPLRRALVDPVRSVLVRRLDGGQRGTWLAALTALFVTLAVAGGTMVAMVPPRPWMLIGACVTLAAFGALLFLESARVDTQREIRSRGLGQPAG